MESVILYKKLSERPGRLDIQGQSTACGNQLDCKCCQKNYKFRYDAFIVQVHHLFHIEGASRSISEVPI